MFSATFPVEVQQVAKEYLVRDYIFVTTGNVGGTNPDVLQEFYQVARNEKRTKLMEVLRDIGDAKVIVFVESKKTADFVAAFLCNNSLQVSHSYSDSWEIVFITVFCCNFYRPRVFTATVFKANAKRR